MDNNRWVISCSSKRYDQAIGASRRIQGYVDYAGNQVFVWLRDNRYFGSGKYSHIHYSIKDSSRSGNYSRFDTRKESLGMSIKYMGAGASIPLEIVASDGLLKFDANAVDDVVESAEFTCDNQDKYYASDWELLIEEFERVINSLIRSGDCEVYYERD